MTYLVVSNVLVEAALQRRVRALIEAWAQEQHRGRAGNRAGRGLCSREALRPAVLLLCGCAAERLWPAVLLCCCCGANAAGWNVFVYVFIPRCHFPYSAV